MGGQPRGYVSRWSGGGIRTNTSGCFLQPVASPLPSNVVNWPHCFSFRSILGSFTQRHRNMLISTDVETLFLN